MKGPRDSHPIRADVDVRSETSILPVSKCEQLVPHGIRENGAAANFHEEAECLEYPSMVIKVLTQSIRWTTGTEKYSARARNEIRAHSKSTTGPGKMFRSSGSNYGEPQLTGKGKTCR
jgi:hypothetical protein